MVCALAPIAERVVFLPVPLFEESCGTAFGKPVPVMLESFILSLFYKVDKSFASLPAHEITHGLAVYFVLRLYPYPFQPGIEVFLREEAQFASRLVIRDCAAHHHLVEITWFHSEIPGRFGGVHQIAFTFHIACSFIVYTRFTVLLQQCGTVRLLAFICLPFRLQSYFGLKGA